MTHVDYVSDDGNTYRVRMSVADANALGVSASTTPHSAAPKGTKPRKRYFRHPTTGRERGLTIPNVGLGAWTQLIGSTLSLPDYSGFGASPITFTSTAFVAEGWVGEKRRAI
jgi:hypothetical protein